MVLGVALYMLIPCFLFAAYLIELGAAYQAKISRSRIRRSSSADAAAGTQDGTASPTDDESRRFTSTWKLVALLHGVNITAALVITTLTVYYQIYHPLIGTLTELHAIIVWLKTASYAFTNRDLRHAYLHPSKGERDALPDMYAQKPYPQNITMGNLCYFWWAPTLIYQPVYPRSPRVRWVFVAKRMAEVFCLSVFIWFASAQYATPVLVNSLDKIASLDFTSILERLLKLSTISLAIWLAGFFALFQSFLNALAEVMRFGDRSFYDPWWNSGSLGAYWRTWNKPVYQYFKRHVYSPLLGRGFSPRAASLMVFLLSAILHEVLVGIPTHNIIGRPFLFAAAFPFPPTTQNWFANKKTLFTQASHSSACSCSSPSSPSRRRSRRCSRPRAGCWATAYSGCRLPCSASRSRPSCTFTRGRPSTGAPAARTASSISR